MKERLTGRLEACLHRMQAAVQRRCVRCPACGALQTVPAGTGQTKIICPRCGEIFLRRL